MACAQRRLAPGDGVLVDVVVDRRAGGVLDASGAAKSGMPWARFTPSVRMVQQDLPRHVADDRFGELAGFARDAGHVQRVAGLLRSVAVV